MYILWSVLLHNVYICMYVCIENAYTHTHLSFKWTHTPLDGSSCAHANLLVVECSLFACQHALDIEGVWGEQGKSSNHPSLDSLHPFEVPIYLQLVGEPKVWWMSSTFMTTLVCNYVVRKTHNFGLWHEEHMRRLYRAWGETNVF